MLTIKYQLHENRKKVSYGRPLIFKYWNQQGATNDICCKRKCNNIENELHVAFCKVNRPHIICKIQHGHAER